jgi:ribosomal-protein-alanine N-acetyltransferase
MLTLRFLNAEDAPWMAKVHGLCFSAPWTEDVFYSFFNAPEWDGVYGFVVEQDNQRVGFILGRTVFDANDILTFAVNPVFQGQGIGATLLRGYLHGLTVPCLLEVSTRNAAAIHVYERAGFAHLTTRKGYYTGADAGDAYVMKWVPGSC